MLSTEQSNNLTLASVAAVASERTTGCPAELTVAQWAQESAWGRHVPPGSNNPFGIKALPGQPSVVASTIEVIHGKAEMFELPFRKFETLKEAFDVHGALIATGAPYGDAFERWEKDHDLPALVAGVAKRYATDPNYGSELMALIAMPVVRAAIATVRKSA